MVDITLKDLPESVHTALKKKAQQTGRSVQAEIRSILADAMGGSCHLDGMKRSANLTVGDACFTFAIDGQGNGWIKPQSANCASILERTQGLRSKVEELANQGWRCPPNGWQWVGHNERPPFRIQ